MILLLLACSSSRVCRDTAEPSWSQLQPVLITHCQSCHASDSPNRYGAPNQSIFDSQADASEQAERIRVRVIEQGDMPPGGGLSDKELHTLALWLDCL